MTAELEAQLDRDLSQAMEERDRAEAYADQLADCIEAITGIENGEHSSGNFPWENAIEAAQEYLAKKQPDEPADSPLVASDAFVAAFKREPASPSDSAWMNGYAAARKPAVERALLYRLASAVASEEGPDHLDQQAAQRWMADEFARMERQQPETKEAKP